MIRLMFPLGEIHYPLQVVGHSRTVVLNALMSEVIYIQGLFSVILESRGSFGEGLYFNIDVTNPIYLACGASESGHFKRYSHLCSI